MRSARAAKYSLLSGTLSPLRDTETDIEGSMLGLALMTMDSCKYAEFGNAAPSMRPWISSAATSTSEPESSCRLITDTLSYDIEETDLTEDILPSACSSTVVTSFSTISAG